MKDLLIFFGEYRTFDVIVPQIKILEKFDIIVSTWNYSNTLHTDICKEDILKILPNAKVIISDFSNSSEYSTNNILYHCKQSLNSININDYNRIFLHRNDLISNIEVLYEMKFEDNTIYTELMPEANRRNDMWMSDYIICGKSNTVKLLIDSFGDEIYKEPHYPFGNKVNQLGLKYENVRFINDKLYFRHHLVREKYNHFVEFIKRLNDNKLYFFDCVINYQKYLEIKQIDNINEKV